LLAHAHVQVVQFLETLRIALLAARKAGRNNSQVTGTASFYRAMSLFRQGKKDEARKLVSEAAGKMVPLPKDEKSRLAGLYWHEELSRGWPTRKRRC
jgi:hypothetical protein